MSDCPTGGDVDICPSSGDRLIHRQSRSELQSQCVPVGVDAGGGANASDDEVVDVLERDSVRVRGQRRHVVEQCQGVRASAEEFQAGRSDEIGLGNGSSRVQGHIAPGRRDPSGASNSSNGEAVAFNYAEVIGGIGCKCGEGVGLGQRKATCAEEFQAQAGDRIACALSHCPTGSKLDICGADDNVVVNQQCRSGLECHSVIARGQAHGAPDAANGQIVGISERDRICVRRKRGDVVTCVGKGVRTRAE